MVFKHRLLMAFLISVFAGYYFPKIVSGLDGIPSQVSPQVSPQERTQGPSQVAVQSQSAPVRNLSPVDLQVESQAIIDHGSAISVFDLIYSSRFQAGWKSLIQTMRARLSRPLPQPAHDDEHDLSVDRELVARLGLIKGLGLLNGARVETKEVLLEFLAAKNKNPWILEREAAHSLLQSGAELTERERDQLIGNLRPIARESAAWSDREIISRALAAITGERGENE